MAKLQPHRSLYHDELSKGVNPLQNRQVATSTSFSGIKRLMKAGYVIRLDDYEIEDPFFKEWIIRFCL